MLTLDHPTHTARQSFTTCISKVRRRDLKRRLNAVTQTIVDESEALAIAAAGSRLHRLPRNALVGGDITTDEMGRVYTQRMAKKGAPGRDIYDDLLALPAHGRCPLCGQRQVSTLDHHLPKAHYPVFAVTPLNLIPSCSECNKAKHDSFPRTAIEVSLHPYFDNIDQQRWLVADVIETHPAALRFRVEPDPAWDATLQQRVRNHFRVLGLAKLYASEASEELLNIRHQLTDLRATAGADAVEAQLADRAFSCTRVRLNGWRTAAYTAWASNEWFCDGGFSA